MPTNRGNALSKGSKLQGGRYVIDGTLGEGAFGITYRARDTRLNRTVAIKELYPGGSQRRGNTVAVPAGYTRDRWQKSVASFLREAQTIASLEHPAIVAVYDQFEENNTAYMVMRFIDGANLMQLAQQRGGRLPEADTLRYIAEVGEALSVLHANGVLHRDVKPSNVIVNRSGHAVLVDFGAARAFVPDQTLTHSVVLTPGFAPPEQFQPRARRGPATDIYALAATCYYLLTANLPDIMDDGRLDDPHLSPQLRAALEHALAYAPAERPQTVAAFLAELQGRAAPPIPNRSPALAPQPAPPADNYATEHLSTPQFNETYIEGGARQPGPHSAPTARNRPLPISASIPLPAPARRRTIPPIIEGSLSRWPLVLLVIAIFVILAALYFLFQNQIDPLLNSIGSSVGLGAGQLDPIIGGVGLLLMLLLILLVVRGGQPPRPGRDKSASPAVIQRTPTPDETIVERSKERTPAGDETLVESSQQRGYTPPPLYPLPVDDYNLEQPRRRKTLPILGGSLAAGVLLATLAVLLLGGKGNAGSGRPAMPVVAANTPTSLLAAATQTLVMIAIVPPTDTVTIAYLQRNISDLPASGAIRDALIFVANRGIIGGYSADSFRPDQAMTRADAAQAAVVAHGWALENPSTTHFSDVSSSSPYYKYVETAYTHGILPDSYKGASFSGDTAVTRGDAALILYHAFK